MGGWKENKKPLKMLYLQFTGNFTHRWKEDLNNWACLCLYHTLTFWLHLPDFIDFCYLFPWQTSCKQICFISRFPDLGKMTTWNECKLFMDGWDWWHSLWQQNVQLFILLYVDYFKLCVCVGGCARACVLLMCLWEICKSIVKLCLLFLYIWKKM